MNYDMNMIKYRKSGFFRIAAAITDDLFYTIWAYRLRRYY